MSSRLVLSPNPSQNTLPRKMAALPPIKEAFHNPPTGVWQRPDTLYITYIPPSFASTYGDKYLFSSILKQLQEEPIDMSWKRYLIIRLHPRLDIATAVSDTAKLTTEDLLKLIGLLNIPSLKWCGSLSLSRILLDGGRPPQMWRFSSAGTSRRLPRSRHSRTSTLAGRGVCAAEILRLCRQAIPGEHRLRR